MRVVNYRQLNTESALSFSVTSSGRKPSVELSLIQKMNEFVLTIPSLCRAMNRFFIIPNEKTILNKFSTKRKTKSY